MIVMRHICALLAALLLVCGSAAADERQTLQGQRICKSLDSPIRVRPPFVSSGWHSVGDCIFTSAGLRVEIVRKHPLLSYAFVRIYASLGSYVFEGFTVLMASCE
jgi:hypothetical protein